MRRLWFWRAPVALLPMVTSGDMARVSALVQREPSAVTVIGPGGSPSWSPSGTKLAYWTDDGLIVREMATGQHMAFGSLPPAQGHAPVWLPDESGLLVVSFGTVKTTKYTDHEVTSYQDMNLFLADLGTAKARSLSDFADESSVGRVSVSPDGKVAVLEGPKLGGPYMSETVKGRTNADHSITWTEVSVPYTGLWLIRLDTAERELLMRDENAMEFSPQVLPDGKRILFERRTRHLSPRLSDERPDTNIALYDTANRRMRLLTRADRALDPKLAPDGRTVAFVRAIWPPDLWLIDTEDGRMGQVDGGKRALIVSWTLNWTPDSRYVLFQSEGDICAVSRTGRGPFHLTSGLQMPELYGRGFSVHPDGKRIAYGTANGNVAVAELDWSAVPGYEPGTP